MCCRTSNSLCAGVRALLVLAGLLSFGGVEAAGQSRTTSALAGRVADETDTALAGAIVRIESESLIGGPLVVATDRQGRFTLSEMPPGDILRRASATGACTSPSPIQPISPPLVRDADWLN